MTIDKEVQKEIAKIGMTATLGATVVTSMFMKNKTAEKVHILAGSALCAFSLWHHFLYDKKTSSKKLENKTKEETPTEEVSK
ncbi:MAG: hypothetical protein KGV43_02505 [Arcobacter sp.]|nr:hypothetical protein [Arcobacter sp.]